MTDKDKVKQLFKERGTVLLTGNDMHIPVEAIQKLLKNTLSITVHITLLVRYESSKILRVVFSDGSVLLLTSYCSVMNDTVTVWLTTSEDIENLCTKMVVMFSLTQGQRFNIERLFKMLRDELTA